RGDRSDQRRTGSRPEQAGGDVDGAGNRPGRRVGDAGSGSPQVGQRVVARWVIWHRLQVWASGGPLRRGSGERVAVDVVAQSAEDAGGRYSVGHAGADLL